MQNDEIEGKVITAYLDLMAEWPFHQVSMRMVAEEAGITLSQLRKTFASEESLLQAFASMIDCAMLDHVTANVLTGGPRERVLGSMLARLLALAPYKRAVGSILMGAAKDPATLLFFNRVSIEEHKWTLIAAGLDSRGARSRNLAEAISQAFVSAAAVWLKEEDKALPRTRNALDQAFAYGDAILETFEMSNG